MRTNLNLLDALFLDGNPCGVAFLVTHFFELTNDPLDDQEILVIATQVFACPIAHRQTGYRLSCCAATQFGGLPDRATFLPVASGGKPLTGTEKVKQDNAKNRLLPPKSGS